MGKRSSSIISSSTSFENSHPPFADPKCHMELSCCELLHNNDDDNNNKTNMGKVCSCYKRVCVCLFQLINYYLLDMLPRSHKYTHTQTHNSIRPGLPWHINNNNTFTHMRSSSSRLINLRVAYLSLIIRNLFLCSSRLMDRRILWISSTLVVIISSRPTPIVVLLQTTYPTYHLRGTGQI